MTENVQQPFRYMGREPDPITGLYYVRNRWYDQVAARFVSEDPIGLEGGINVYAYVGNSPTNLRDPFGLDPTIEQCMAKLVEEGASQTFAKKACKAGFQVGGIVAGPYWDPFGQNNATLAALMVRTDGFLAGLRYPLSGYACDGGFSDGGCQQVREALVHLRTHRVAVCRFMGVQGTRRFMLGNYVFEADSTGYYGRVDSIPSSMTLNPPLNRPLYLTPDAFQRGHLANTIAHEETHHIGGRHPQTFTVGDLCASSHY